MNRLLILFILFTVSFFLKAQNQKQADKELFNIIFKLDSAWFEAFNNKKTEAFNSYIDKSLEFYHDKTGLTGYDYNINAFKNIFQNVSDLKRELLKETLEVYPIPGYGAVQIAQHRFCHMENGKLDCGIFKFIHVWKKTEEGWKVTRIISVDH